MTLCHPHPRRMQGPPWAPPNPRPRRTGIAHGGRPRGGSPVVAPARRRPRRTPPPVVALPPVAPVPQTPVPPSHSRPPLELLESLSSEPEYARWLQASGLVDRIAAAVAAVSEGNSPREPLSFLAPQGSFKVEERKAGTFISAASYARYDTVARVVSSLDVKAAGRAYSALRPALSAVLCESWLLLGRALSRHSSVPSRPCSRCPWCAARWRWCPAARCGPTRARRSRRSPRPKAPAAHGPQERRAHPGRAARAVRGLELKLARR